MSIHSPLESKKITPIWKTRHRKIIPDSRSTREETRYVKAAFAPRRHNGVAMRFVSTTQVRTKFLERRDKIKELPRALLMEILVKQGERCYTTTMRKRMKNRTQFRANQVNYTLLDLIKHRKIFSRGTRPNVRAVLH